MNIASSLFAIFFYMLATAMLLHRLRTGNNRRLGTSALILGLFAVVAHGVAAVTAIATPEGADLGLSQLFSLLSGMICLITLTTSLRLSLIHI